MGEKWTVDSVNGTRTGREGEWKNLDQIEGSQTRLRYNLFGMNFRIAPIGDGKYRLSEFSANPLNINYRLMKEHGIDVEEAYEEIGKELCSGVWTELNIKGLMDYGVVIGILTKYELEDRISGTNKSGEFRAKKDIEKILDLEWTELDINGYRKSEKTDEEKLESLETVMKIISNPTDSLKFVYEKYKKIVEEKKEQRESGAKSILEFMKSHDLSTQDLALALSMAQATKTGVREAESHMIDEKTNQVSTGKEEQVKED